MFMIAFCRNVPMKHHLAVIYIDSNVLNEVCGPRVILQGYSYSCDEVAISLSKKFVGREVFVDVGARSEPVSPL